MFYIFYINDIINYILIICFKLVKIILVIRILILSFMDYVLSNGQMNLWGVIVFTNLLFLILFLIE